MEMAMGNNTEYMGRFQRDLKAQRFDIIVVDPLNYSIYARRRAFSDENNVWVKNVMEHILCNYQVDVVYPDDEIALYVPQSGEQQCP
ncbi:MAG TPA: hypothetical protein DCX53_12090, partial [Anaerolineae bacterium]|nr:hypothetical protein [Anaerolineae bacterium]